MGKMLELASLPALERGADRPPPEEPERGVRAAPHAHAHDDIAYDDTYNGLVVGNAEGDRLADVLGGKLRAVRPEVVRDTYRMILQDTPAYAGALQRPEADPRPRGAGLFLLSRCA